MKKNLALISILFLLFSCSKNFFSKPEIVELKASEEFVQGSEDIPLLVGMEKITGESIGFDSDFGSIISSNYSTQSDLKKVKNFYSKTLPQLGWKLVASRENNSTFKRDKEKLEIEFAKEDGKNLVKFFLSSAL